MNLGISVPTAPVPKQAVFSGSSANLRGSGQQAPVLLKQPSDTLTLFGANQRKKPEPVMSMSDFTKKMLADAVENNVLIFVRDQLAQGFPVDQKIQTDPHVLIADKRNPKRPSPKQVNLLEKALESGTPQMVALLLRFKPRLSKQEEYPLILEKALRRPDIPSALIEKMIRLGADVNDGSPLYIAACDRRSPALVSLLLAKGAEPNPDSYKHYWKPMVVGAALQGNAEVVRQLLAFESNPVHLNKALDQALRFSDTDPQVFELLIQAGADPNMACRNEAKEDNHSGWNWAKEAPIHRVMNLALQSGHIGWGREDYTDAELETMQTHRYNELEVIEALQAFVKAGVDMTEKNAKGETILDVAQQNNLEQVVSYLLFDKNVVGFESARQAHFEAKRKPKP